MGTKRRRKTTTDAKTFEASAKDATRAIRAITVSLVLEDVSVEEAANDGRRAGRVPRKAVAIAAAVIERDAGFGATFDARALRDAVAYEVAMAPLAALVVQLGERILRSIRKRNGDAANQTLALYAYLKGLALINAGAPAAEMRALRKLLTRNRKRRATSVTAKEAAAETRRLKLTKIAAAKKKRAERL